MLASRRENARPGRPRRPGSGPTESSSTSPRWIACWLATASPRLIAPPPRPEPCAITDRHAARAEIARSGSRAATSALDLPALRTSLRHPESVALLRAWVPLANHFVGKDALVCASCSTISAHADSWLRSSHDLCSEDAGSYFMRRLRLRGCRDQKALARGGSLAQAPDNPSVAHPGRGFRSPGLRSAFPFHRSGANGPDLCSPRA